MTDEEMLYCFAEGFAKTAEAAGFSGEQVRELMELSVGLAQRAVHPESSTPDSIPLSEGDAWDSDRQATTTT